MLAVSLLIYFSGSKLRLEGKRKRAKYDYSKLPQFAKYDVENGYLLDVTEGDSIEFTVDAPMTYNHPLQPGWAKILMVFPKVRSAQWIQKTMRPTADPDGIVDYGRIDSFTVEGEKSHLSGEWGEIEIVSDPVVVGEIQTS
jgi:hypothetical protein